MKVFKDFLLDEYYDHFPLKFVMLRWEKRKNVAWCLDIPQLQLENKKKQKIAFYLGVDYNKTSHSFFVSCKHYPI